MLVPGVLSSLAGGLGPTFMMIWRLGTIMVTPRNSAFRFSGSSCRPAYLPQPPHQTLNNLKQHKPEKLKS